MRTRDKLADALRESGLVNLADRAATGEFDDFESPHAFPQIELVKTLQRYVDAGSRNQSVLSRNSARLIERVKAGDFDATKEEAEAWQASPEGRAAFNDLVEGR